ncbi:hypothetical protein EDD85DRAFT_218647 [Armillaria nabsnona]|nr:hypothetical protein EDD85DRAFT_218647 [Armillaria nabsnona]
MRRRRPRHYRRSPNRYPAPERWRDIYDAINAMHSDIVAPVDSMQYSAPLKEKEPQNQFLCYSGVAHAFITHEGQNYWRCGKPAVSCARRQYFRAKHYLCGR